MDDTNFVDAFRKHFYIDDVGEADEVASGDGTNTPIDEAYGEMMVEEHTKHDGIDNAAYEKLIGARLITDVPGEVPKISNSSHFVDGLDR